jgi:hypothetical protein
MSLKNLFYISGTVFFILASVLAISIFVSFVPGILVD